MAPSLQPYIDGLGRLRIAVFRDYPYLDDGRSSMSGTTCRAT